MKVAIFGAAGKTGRELVSQSLAKDFVVTAFVRNPAKFDIRHTNLRIVQGDAADYASVERAVENQNAVLCALGSPNLSGDSSLIEGVRQIVRAMERKKVKRLIYLSVLGAGGVRCEQLGFINTYIVIPLILKNIVAEHELKENIIEQSDLDWTIVRPPRLTSGIRAGIYRHGENIRADSLIPTFSRADLADFMLRQITDKTYSRKTPAVMY